MNNPQWQCVQCRGYMDMGASAVLGESHGEVFCGDLCHRAYMQAVDDPCDDCPIHRSLRKLAQAVLNAGPDARVDDPVEYAPCAAAAREALVILRSTKAAKTIRKGGG